jgi:hypothetical protein
MDLSSSYEMRNEFVLVVWKRAIMWRADIRVW